MGSLMPPSLGHLQVTMEFKPKRQLETTMPTTSTIQEKVMKSSNGLPNIFSFTNFSYKPLTFVRCLRKADKNLTQFHFKTQKNEDFFKVR